jgi:RNA polymerase sigma factor (sigma-70 family)
MLPDDSASPRRPLTAAQQELARRYLPLARRLTWPSRVAWPASRDEFESAALMALVQAAQAYDPTRQVKFATFARLRIIGALRDVQRRWTPAGWRSDPAHAPLIGPLQSDSELNGRVLNTEPDPPAGWETESAEEVEAWLKKLPPRHAAACRQIYLHGKTQTEAAEALGCSQSRLCCLHREALAMLNGTWGKSKDD